MNRRKFLGRVAGVVAGVAVAPVVALKALAAPSVAAPVIAAVTHTEFGLGFEVIDEMLSNHDSFLRHARFLQNAAAHALDKRNMRLLDGEVVMKFKGVPR